MMAGKKIRVLLIDDDVQVCQMLSSYLTKKGFAVTTAFNGNQGLARFVDEPFDVVVCDLVMPDKEGIETVMELRKLSTDVGVVAMSGGGRIGPESYLDLARALGADVTFEKPVPINELAQAITALAGRRKT